MCNPAHRSSIGKPRLLTHADTSVHHLGLSRRFVLRRRWSHASHPSGHVLLLLHHLLGAHQLLLLKKLGVLMLVHLIRRHLLGMTACASGSGRLGNATRGGGCCSLPQTLLREVDGLGLGD